LAEPTLQNACERLVRLEEVVKGHDEDIENLGGTLDHVVNTVDTILVPQQIVNTERLAEHDKVTREAHDFIMSQRGAWAFIQKFGIVVAAISSVVLLVMKIWGIGK